MIDQHRLMGWPFSNWWILPAWRQARVSEKVEKLMVGDAYELFNMPICVLLIDAAEPIHKQDLAIARLIEDEGQPLSSVNKWDAVRDKAGAADLLLTV